MHDIGATAMILIWNLGTAAAIVALGALFGSRLFRVSRHPNFFFEQAQWWVIAAFGVISAGTLPVTVAGAVLLTLLFVGSTRFTEQISKAKYPEYADYQARTSAVVPWFPRSSIREEVQGLDRVRAMGYPERFVRMWEFYLSYCEGGFIERSTGDVQMLLVKPGARRAEYVTPIG